MILAHLRGLDSRRVVGWRPASPLGKWPATVGPVIPRSSWLLGDGEDVWIVGTDVTRLRPDGSTEPVPLAATGRLRRVRTDAPPIQVADEAGSTWALSGATATPGTPTFPTPEGVERGYADVSVRPTSALRGGFLPGRPFELVVGTAGRPAWTAAGPLPQGAPLPDGVLTQLDSGGPLQLREADSGRVRWSTPVPASEWAWVRVHDALWFPAGPNRWVACGLGDGALRGELQSPLTRPMGPVDVRGRLHLLGGGSVEVRDLTDGGKRVGGRPARAAGTGPVLVTDDGGLVCGERSGEIVYLPPDDTKPVTVTKLRGPPVTLTPWRHGLVARDAEDRITLVGG